MSDVTVEYGDNRQETAILLLAAAEELGVDQSSIRTTRDGYVVSEEVRDKAFGSGEKKPAKKAAAKKSAAKKAAASESKE